MTISRPSPVTARQVSRQPILGSVVFWGVAFCTRHSVFSQVTARELYKDIFKASLTRTEMFELTTIASNRIQKRRNGKMRLADAQTDSRIFATNRFHARKRSPAVEIIVIAVGAYVAHLELNHVMTTKSLDQIGRGAFRDYLPVVDYGQTIAEPLGLIHVMSGEQDSPTVFLKGANNGPKLATAV